LDSHHIVFRAKLTRFGIELEVYYTRCLIKGNPCLFGFDYGSDINVVSQRLVEKLKLPTSFHLNQAWINFNTRQCVKEVLCNIAPMHSFHLLLGWAWLRFKILNLDERSLYLRHEWWQTPALAKCRQEKWSSTVKRAQALIFWAKIV